VLCVRSQINACPLAIRQRFVAARSAYAPIAHQDATACDTTLAAMIRIGAQVCASASTLNLVYGAKQAFASKTGQSCRPFSGACFEFATDTSRDTAAHDPKRYKQAWD
jgi:hypothetical protein